MVQAESVEVWVEVSSWLARSGHVVLFFSPPVLERPGVCAGRTWSAQAWRAFPPPRPVPATSPVMMPMRSHACLHVAAVVNGLVKMSLRWPSGLVVLPELGPLENLVQPGHVHTVSSRDMP